MSDSTSPDNLPGSIPGILGSFNAMRQRYAPGWLIGGVVVIAMLSVVGGLLYRWRTLDAPIPDGVQTHYAGLERGTTDQGFPRLGSADAPVIIEDFSSYACPHCRHFHEEQFEALLDEIAAGQVQFIFIPVPHIGWGSDTAAKGALCAGEQGQFWEMHDTLFYWQDRFIVSTFNNSRIKQAADKLGLDTAAFERCMDDNRPQAVIDQARSEFERRELRGTPSFFINGERVRDYSEFDNLGN
ncbi:MAG: DsbA family protein [Anaerolineae bacterium]|nr:DsbA family protein [Anaerolineae bacterium]